MKATAEIEAGVCGLDLSTTEDQFEFDEAARALDRIDHLVVALGSARLRDHAHARLQRELGTVGEGEEGIRREDGTPRIVAERPRLLEERQRVLKELGHYDDVFGATPQSADGDLSSYSFHMADQGTDAMEREKAFLFASQEGRFLWHIDQALRRLYKSPETFGKCHNCGEDIAFERLDALPHARYCIRCKQREEDGKQ